MGNKLFIDIYCNDGSPLNLSPSDVHGKNGRMGVGGAELALFTMIEHWLSKDYVVRLYNDPVRKDRDSRLEQYRRSEFRPPDKRDILITFRSPNPVTVSAYGKKVWWSTDQRTVGNFAEFAKTQEKIVTISPHHAGYFESVYGIRDTITMDLPVRVQDYCGKTVERNNHRALFSSVPDRGLPVLANVWDKIVDRVPDAELVVTSGWTLWDGQSDESRLLPYRLLFRDKRGRINYRGAVTRDELVKEQLGAGVLAYPNVYDELFCYAVAEAQVAGAIPVTSTIGALGTTNMLGGLQGDPYSHTWQDAFVDKVVEVMLHGDIIRPALQHNARTQYSVDRIGEQWDRDVFFS